MSNYVQRTYARFYPIDEPSRIDRGPWYRSTLIVAKRAGPALTWFYQRRVLEGTANRKAPAADTVTRGNCGTYRALLPSAPSGCSPNSRRVEVSQFSIPPGTLLQQPKRTMVRYLCVSFCVQKPVAYTYKPRSRNNQLIVSIKILSSNVHFVCRGTRNDFKMQFQVYITIFLLKICEHFYQV